MRGGYRPVPVDVSDESTTLVHHDLSVHGVDGLQPGAYRWWDSHIALLKTGDFRSVAEHLCLAQPLGADAAFTAFHMSDVDEVLAVLSSRGYRACQLEAGVAAGRLAWPPSHSATARLASPSSTTRSLGSSPPPQPASW